MRFTTKSIEQVTKALIDYRGKTPKKTASGVKLVTAKVIKDGFITRGEHEYIAEDDYDTWMRRGLPKQWDILITTEAPMGEVAQLRTPERVALAQRVILLRGNPGVIDQAYYYYALQSAYVQNQLRARSTGTTVLGIKQSELRQVLIPLYPMPVQRGIAGVLSAYDDLIENNTRRIEILEEMAQAIYREWFVNFRFPGHEKVRMVDSALGLIPEGWEWIPIGDVVQVLGGGTPSTKCPEYWDGGDINWFTPSDLTAAGTMFMTGSSRRITKLGLEYSSAKLFPAYSVMMTSRATIGVVAINTEPSTTNQGFIICIPNDKLSAYQIYFWVLENRDKIEGIASGATFKEINRTEFKALTILVADQRTQAMFTEFVQPVGRQIETLQQAVGNLRQTRDLLLPKLISGEVDVSELDIDAGPVPEEGAA